MLMPKSYFDLAIQAVKQDFPENSLLKAIKYLAAWHQNIIDWQVYEANLVNIHTLHLLAAAGLVFQKTSVPSDLNDICYPLLIKLKDKEEFIALLPSKKIKTDLNVECIEQVWQCLSIKHQLPCGLLGLYHFAFKLFKSELIRQVALSGILSASGLMMALLVGYIFNHLYDFNGMDFFIFYLFSLIFITGLMLVKCLNEYCVNKLNLNIQIYLFPVLWHQLLNSSIDGMKKYSSAINKQCISDYESAVSTILTNSLTTLANMAGAIFLLIYMFYCNFIVSFIYASIFLCVAILKFFLFSRHSSLIASYLSRQGGVSSILTEIFMQIDKIRSAYAESFFHKIWLQTLLLAKQSLEKSIKLEIKLAIVDILLPILMLLVFYLYLIWHPAWVSQHQLEYMMCAGQLAMLLEKTSVSAVALSFQLPGLKGVSRLIQDNVNATIAKEKGCPARGIVLSNVTFIRDDRCILNNISIHFPVGHFIGIVGKSGAGKSSLFRLLLGLEQDYTGLIQLDGVDVKQQNMMSVRKKMGVVLQTTHLFPGTIFSNIAANTPLTLNAAWQLAKEVGLYEDIQRMPMKMYTHISDNAGESISGGQKQKILIARALASRPRYLLLDEATSALDNKSQAIIFKHLKLLNITLIVIAHRLTTLADADLIYVLKDGRMFEQSKE